MSTENVLKNGAETAEAPKKRRVRGVTNETRAVSRKKFDEQRDANRSNGLFIGHLDNVEINWATLKEDANIPQFAGQAIPYLTFTFASNEEKEYDRKYVTARFSPVESNVDTIPGGKDEWKVNLIFQFMKHIYDVFVLKGRPMTEAEEDALTLPFEDFEDDGQGGYQYISLEPEVIITGYKSLFENFVKLINNDGKPHYKNANGGIVPIWMKLIRFIRNKKNEWKSVANGDLSFPTFVGEGVVELFDANKQPSLKLDIHKESITYKEEAMKAKTPNVGAPTGGVAPTAAPMNPAFGGAMNSAFGGFNESPATNVDTADLPF